jgi:hypothetical protein
MAQWFPVQADFSAGVLSPSLHLQQNTERYQRGLAKAVNMIVGTRGEVASRRGSAFIRDVGQGATKARVIPIETTQEGLVLALLGGGKCQVYGDTILVPTSQWVKNSEFDAGLTDWSVYNETSGYIVALTDEDGRRVVRFGAEVPKYEWGLGYIRQTLDISRPITEFAFEYALRSPFPKSTLNNYMTISVSIEGYDPGDAKLVYRELVIPPGGVSAERIEIPITGSYQGPVYIEFFGSIGVLDLDFCRAWSNPPTIPAVPTLDIPYTDDELDQVQYVTSPYTQQTVFVHPKHPPQELVFTQQAGWSWQAIVFDLNPGEDPDWSPEQGYPGAVGGFQGRLVLAGSPGNPQSVWASEAGNWYTLGYPADPAGSDPVWYTMSERGPIRWVAGQKTMLHGTSNGEYVVTGAQGYIAAGDVQVNRQSSYGSAPYLQPGLAGESIMWVGNDKATVRAMNYDDNQQGWKGRDIVWAAEHLTRVGIRRIVYCHDPFRTLVCVLNNGDVASMEYEPTLELFPWCIHNTLGAFEDVCNARVAGRDYIFFIVRRYIDGEDKLYLEVIEDRQAPGSRFHLDSSIVFNSPTPTLEITGLSHLKGGIVSVLGHQGYLGEYKVSDTGTVTLDEGLELQTAVVGFRYTQEMETLPVPVPYNVGDLNAPAGWSEIGVGIVASAVPIINGVRPAERFPASLQDLGQSPNTRKVQIASVGYKRGATVNIKQDLPLPLLVAGVYGKVSVERM